MKYTYTKLDNDKVSDDLGVRINFIVATEVNDTLNKLIPKGSKGDVMRCLTTLYIEANKKYGREFMMYLLDENVELIKREH